MSIYSYYYSVIGSIFFFTFVKIISSTGISLLTLREVFFALLFYLSLFINVFFSIKERHIRQTRDMKIKPKELLLVYSLIVPIIIGRKKPPSPPAAPTKPPTVPVSFGKYSATSLKTTPLPIPNKHCHAIKGCNAKHQRTVQVQVEENTNQ